MSSLRAIAESVAPYLSLPDPIFRAALRPETPSLRRDRRRWRGFGRRWLRRRAVRAHERSIRNA